MEVSPRSYMPMLQLDAIKGNGATKIHCPLLPNIRIIEESVYYFKYIYEGSIHITNYGCYKLLVY